MPSRKSRKRKASSRKKSSTGKRSRRRIPANALSSDEDYVLESEGEDSGFGSNESEASSEDEGAEEEEEEDEDKDEEEVVVVVEEEDEKDFSTDALRSERSARRSAHRMHRRRPRRKPNSSDEEFNVDLERDSIVHGSAGEGHSHPRSARARHHHVRSSVSDMDFDVAAEQHGVQGRASRPARVRQRKRRKQHSSDEDFQVPIENGLDDGANEGAVATRPVTRAMEAGHVSDSFIEGLGFGSVQLGGRNAIESSDTLLKSNSKTGEASLSISSSSARGASTTDKEMAVNKRKGKEKVMEGGAPAPSQFKEELVVSGTEEGTTAAVVCGICLNETAVIERGKLDCCDHFFCFGCIMEWAKVESRCPMCKQRFASVAKAGRDVSKRTRTVRIPLRDQVYVPPEDDLPFEDPYADVICMECHGIGDEGLLLLCDRCDSAAHTFCVGLGRSVPRGDWYCRDCQALTRENSGSESEPEELVLDSDSEEEEDEDFLIRSIVASESQPTRQRRVQRGPVSTFGPPLRPTRRLGAGERRRIWRRSSSRGRRRRAATAPQLSQAARAFVASVAPELNPVSRVSEAPQSGSARTVPQQRRLQERIIAMRNNWGRIQNGDVQFDAIRTQAVGSDQLTMSTSRTAMSSSGTALAVNGSVDADSAETSHVDKDLEQAWQKMGEARDLSAGTSSSGMHPQRSHHAPVLPTPRPSSQPMASRIVKATSSMPSASNRTTHVASSRLSESSDANNKRGLKESLELPPGREKGLTLSPVVMEKNGEERKQDHHSSSSNIVGHIDPCRTSQLKGGNIAVHSVDNCNNSEKTAMDEDRRPQMLNAGGNNLGRTYNLTGNGADREAVSHAKGSDGIKSMVNLGLQNLGRSHNLTGNRTGKERVSHAKESNVAKASFSPPQEGLKVHLIELVKKQTWPVYIAERLDKEQFKRIARAAVHSLLDLCDPSNKSVGLSCNHLDQGKNPIVDCCTKCLDQHVEIAVKNAKDKIVPR